MRDCKSPQAVRHRGWDRIAEPSMPLRGKIRPGEGCEATERRLGLDCIVWHTASPGLQAVDFSVTRCGQPDVIAALAQPADDGPGCVRQPSGRGDQNIERRAFWSLDRTEYLSQLAARALGRDFDIIALRSRGWRRTNRREAGWRPRRSRAALHLLRARPCRPFALAAPRPARPSGGPPAPACTQRSSARSRPASTTVPLPHGLPRPRAASSSSCQA